MIVVDVLLGCNLLVFLLCAARAPRPARVRIDDLVAAARLSPPADCAPGEGATVIAFPTPDEMARRRARAAHPSAGSPLGHPSGHRSLGSR